MKQKLWETGNNNLIQIIEDYTVGDDYILDQQLLPYDIKASLAHAEALFDISIINEQELMKIKEGLNFLLSKVKKNTFIIQKEQEDGHTAIEQFLTDKYGDIGKKIHTGRSRNDQSLVMMRLFMKEKLGEINNLTQDLKQSFSKKIASNKNIPMPGYTHMQKAMPTTIGMRFDSFLSAIKDFESHIKLTTMLIDQNPLGSASGFGIENFKLNRKITTQKLGFKKIQDNPMYCGFSRGYFENIVLQSLSQIMIISAKFANDMMLFTTQEFGFLSLPDNFTTGSSIMPQKRNYDLFEIMRGNIKTFSSYQNEIQSIVSSIGSGYQRDLQLTKKPFILGMNLCETTIKTLTIVIENIQINQKKLKDSMTDDVYVTNKVYDLVKEGMTFREAYIQIKKERNN